MLLDLSRGPMRSTALLEKFFLETKRNKATRIGAGWRRLRKMRQGGLIKYFPNYRLPDPVIVLTPKGAIPVCEHFGLDIEKTWIHIPNEKHCFHDTYVADALRKFFMDEEDRKFSVDDYFYEKELKKIIMRDRFHDKKGIGYPDLIVIVSDPSGQLTEYHIEIDCGSVSSEAIRQKISFRSHAPFLFLTNEETRLWHLFNLISDFKSKIDFRDIFVTETKEFFSENFAQSRWLKPPNEEWVFLKTLGGGKK